MIVFQGGVKAVVWTDVFQATIMIGSVLTVFVYSLLKVNGFSEVIRTNLEGKRIHAIEY